MDQSRRRITSLRQLELLIQFMENHSDLALGRVRGKEGRALSTRLWEECANILNAEGHARTGKEWTKVWSDYKCKVKQKLSAIRRDHVGTGGGPSEAPELSSMEDRVASLIGRDVGPLTGVRRDPVFETNNIIYEDIQIDHIQHQVSPTILISQDILPDSVINNHMSITPNGSPDRTITIDTPERPLPQNNLSQTENIPRNRERRPRENRIRARPRPRLIHQSNTAALDEARASIARIEELRAQADARQAEAAVTQAEALRSLAESARIIALSFQAYIHVQASD